MNLNDVNLNDKIETLEKMTEDLLSVIKVEIQNLETEIEVLDKQREALSLQKSRLQNTLNAYNELWCVISSNRETKYS